LVLLLTFALEAGFAALAWICVFKQAIVRFITFYLLIFLFYIVSRFVIIHRAEVSLFCRVLTMWMLAAGLLFRVTVFILEARHPAF
jgi:hypothetical protein